MRDDNSPSSRHGSRRRHQLHLKANELANSASYPPFLCTCSLYSGPFATTWKCNAQSTHLCAPKRTMRTRKGIRSLWPPGVE
jgi:hypothetical protein